MSLFGKGFCFVKTNSNYKVQIQRELQFYLQKRIKKTIIDFQLT